MKRRYRRGKFKFAIPTKGIELFNRSKHTVFFSFDKSRMRCLALVGWETYKFHSAHEITEIYFYAATPSQISIVYGSTEGRDEHYSLVQF